MTRLLPKQEEVIRSSSHGFLPWVMDRELHLHEGVLGALPNLLSGGSLVFLAFQLVPSQVSK